jgi:UDP:flavonoid glycosyltransferase YjiC (YdhE family)
MLILSIPYTHTLSHLSRPLAVSRELRARGHEVVFAGESSKIKFIEQAGFPVLPLYEPDPEILFGNIRAGNIRFVTDKEIERLIDADLALFREVKPDLVLSDGRFSALISTHIARLMHAAIVNASSTEYRALPYIPLFDWISGPGPGGAGLFRRAIDRLNLRLEMFVFDNTMRIFRTLSRRYGLERAATATNCLAGKDITFMADIPEYFPTRNLPDTYHYIGPLTWQSSTAPPAWWPPDKKGAPLIYITMGTTGIEGFFQKIHDVIEGSEMSAIVTTGRQASGIEPVQGKLFVEDYIDGDLVMEACDLVVCHGGNGTIYQALGHGKPVLGIPTIPDQRFNMRRVEALGVGKTLTWKEFNRKPSRLLECARAIRSERTFYRNAASLEHVLGGYDAAKSAADIIERSLG